MLARWTLLLRRLAPVFILYVILRGLFLFCNRRFFRDIGIDQIGLAFLQGLRFDLSAIAAINFLFIFLTFLPRMVESPPGYERMLKWVFLVLNIPFVIFNIVDLEYFQFTGRGSSLALAFIAGDAGVKISGMDPQRVTQHADILPSLLDYLKVQPERRLLFGTSIFRQSEGRAFLHINEQYWLVCGTNAFEFAPEGPSRLFDLTQDPQLRSPLPVDLERGRALEKEAKALAQYFNNGMLENTIYDKVVTADVSRR